MAKEKTYIMSRRFKVVPLKENKEGQYEVDTESYDYIRNSIYAQYRALNLGMGHQISTYYKYDRDFLNEDYKEEINSFKYNKANPLFNDIEFGSGLDTLSLVRQKVKKDFSTALKNGLANGDRSANNYKRSFPLMTRNRNLKFYTNDKDEVFIKWVNGINLKVILGRKSNKNYEELQHTINKIMTGEYKIGQGQLFFDKKNTLNIDIPINIANDINKKEVKSKKERIMGIDLGLSIPAYAVIADNPLLRESFGSKFELLKTKTQFSERRKRVQKQLKLAKGGKGRKDKLSALESFSKKERNWTKTYNHQMSKAIIDYAIKNKVTQINLEKLNKEGIPNRVLGKWCYYELQQMITYKAERELIKVKYINPAYTSQKCSKCGHTHRDNRKNQEEFACVECGYKNNADFNAALNISRSVEYM